MFFPLQDVLNEVSHGTGKVGTQVHNSLYSFLHKSYDLLPSEQHRLMFLDAALIMRGRPVVQLVAFWEGALLLDNPETSLLPSQRINEAEYPFQRRRGSAAALLARRLVDDLYNLTLITYDLTIDAHPLNSRCTWKAGLLCELALLVPHGRGVSHLMWPPDA